MRLGIFRHIDARKRQIRVKQSLRDGLGSLRFSDAGRTSRRNVPIGRLEPRPAALRRRIRAIFCNAVWCPTTFSATNCSNARNRCASDSISRSIGMPANDAMTSATASRCTVWPERRFTRAPAKSSTDTALLRQQAPGQITNRPLYARIQSLGIVNYSMVGSKFRGR